MRPHFSRENKMNTVVLTASFLAGSYGGFFCFDGIRKTYEHFKCQYAEGTIQTILAFQSIGPSTPRRIPIKIVRIDEPLDTARISGLSLIFAGAALFGSLLLSSLILKTALAGAAAMLLAAASGYLLYHRFSSNVLKEAAIVAHLQQRPNIDRLPQRQLPVRLYLHDDPFFTDQPVYCPGAEPSTDLRIPIIG